MSIKKQISVKTELKSIEQVLKILAGRLDELSNSFCYEAVKTNAIIKLLAEKNLLTEDEVENKVEEIMKEALEKASTETKETTAETEEKSE